jgi:segregation and condensation protein B
MEETEGSIGVKRGERKRRARSPAEDSTAADLDRSTRDRGADASAEASAADAGKPDADTADSNAADANAAGSNAGVSTDANAAELADTDDDESGNPSLDALANDSTSLSAGNELSDDELLQAVTALVYASPEPLSERRLVALLEGPEPARVKLALETLKARLVESRLPLQLVSIAGGWQIVTAQEMAETVQRLFKARKAERVSPAGLETLAVVAYRQPVTKADIEAIRGVQVGPILRTLVDRGFVRVTGRADVPGHPLEYGTTRLFLERFGLSAIEDLPRDSELAKD